MDISIYFTTIIVIAPHFLHFVFYITFPGENIKRNTGKLVDIPMENKNTRLRREIQKYVKPLNGQILTTLKIFNHFMVSITDENSPDTNSTSTNGSHFVLPHYSR